MSSGSKNLGCRHWGILALIASAGLAWGDVGPNPYQPIFERNVFALNPPPPEKPATPTNTPPPAPMAKVVLTGITSIGPKKALLEITEQEAGKQATVRKPILREGEREGTVEVISINFEKSTVLARIGNVETNLTFEVQKMASSAPAGPAGAAPGRPPIPIPALPTPNPGGTPAAPATPSSEPNIISRNPVGVPVDRTGIGLYGATPSAVSSPTPTYSGGSYGGGVYNSGAAAISSVSPGYVGTTLASAGNTANPNSAVDTSRNIRSGSSPAAAGTPINPVAQWIKMSALEEAGMGPPTPPLPKRYTGQ